MIMTQRLAGGLATVGLGGALAALMSNGASTSDSQNASHQLTRRLSQAAVVVAEPWSDKGNKPGLRTLNSAQVFENNPSNVTIQRTLSNAAVTVAEPWSGKGHTPGQRTIGHVIESQ